MQIVSTWCVKSELIIIYIAPFFGGRDFAPICILLQYSSTSYYSTLLPLVLVRAYMTLTPQHREHLPNSF